MTSRCRSVKAEPHVSRHVSVSLVDAGQASFSVKLLCNVVEVQRGVEVVPAQHPQRWQAAIARLARSARS